MALDAVINYTDPGNFTFDSDVIEIDTFGADLKEIDNAGQTFNQPFTNDVGFTYDSAKTEFAAGKVQQKDITPANSTCAATYTTDINLSWGGGVLTGVATGGAAVVSNQLDLAHNDVRYVSYDANLNADSQQIGAFKFKYTPNYSGTPTSNQMIILACEAASDNTNSIRIYHSTGGQLKIQIWDQNDILQVDFYALWSPTAAVPYEFELNYNGTIAATRLFIDGTQFGGTDATTFTRSVNITLLRIGNDYGGGANNSNFYIEDFIVFNAVQHTANYTPGYTLVETKYTSDLITCPIFTYSGVGSVQAFTAFATTETNDPHYILNNKYWNGSSWIVSDGSYGQANTYTVTNTNISSFAAVDSITVKIVTETSNDQDSVDDMTITYTGEAYSTANPYIDMKTHILMDGLAGFVETDVTKPGGSVLKYILSKTGSDVYWGGAAWVVSDGTYAQSNTAAEIHTNRAALDLSAGENVKISHAFLNSNGSVTPIIKTITMSYDFYVPASDYNTVLLYIHLKDPSGVAISGAKIIAKASAPIIHGNHTIWYESEATTNAAGYAELTAIETTTINKYVSIEIFYNDGVDDHQEIYTNILIPNQVSVDINSLIADKTGSASWYRSIKETDYKEGWFTGKV